MSGPVFRVARCPERFVVVVAVDYGVSAGFQLLLDNVAHLLKHKLQRNIGLRFLRDLRQVDKHKIWLVLLEASAAMIAFICVAVFEIALMVQHVVIVLSQKAYISMIPTGVYYPACLLAGAFCIRRFERF